MNHVYRVIFNRSLGVYQCVSELAKSGGKSSSRSTVNNKSGVILSALSAATLSMVAVGAQAQLTINGGITRTVTDPEVLTVVDQLNIGNGTLIVDTGGTVNVTDQGYTDIGRSAGAGSLIVSGGTYNTKLLRAGLSNTGTLAISNSGQLNTSRLIIGDNANGIATVSGTGSVLNATSQIYIGNNNTGSLTVKEGAEVNAQNTYLGEAATSSGTLTVDNAEYGTQSLQVGKNGTATLNISNNGQVIANNVTRNINANSSIINFDNGILKLTANQPTLFNNFTNANTINLATGGGTIDTNGNDVDIVNLAIIGGVGDFTKLGSGQLTMQQRTNQWLGDTTVNQGILKINGDHYVPNDKTLTVTGSNSLLNVDYLSVGSVSKGSATIESGGVIDAQSIVIGANGGSEGKITVTGTNSILKSNSDVYFGNGSNSSLSINDNGRVITKNIALHPQALAVTTNFDNGFLTLTGPTTELFKNFQSDDTINLDNGGGTIDTNGNDVGIVTSAVIGGVGSFTKSGTGTLSMNTINNKAWTGATNVNQGVLQITDDYTMNNGEILGIGLNSATDYGQLKVNGTADISEGTLQVNAAQAVTQLSGNPTWNEVVSATTLTTKFKQVTDNSPLVDFNADYSSIPNAVNLRMVAAPTPPVITPPVVVPPVVVPPIVVPPVIKPPVVVPPVVPPVEPPPVEPETPSASSTFVRAVMSQANLVDLDIARVLDRAIDDRVGMGTNTLNRSLAARAQVLTNAGNQNTASVTNGKNALADALISDTVDFSQSQLAAAANQLQPLAMGATNRIITDTNYNVSDAIISHSPNSRNRSLWAQIIGSEGSHDTENGVSGYDSSSYGVIAGLDIPINNELSLGVAVSYIDTDIDTTDRLDHNIDAKSWQVLGYGGYHITDATHLNFHAGAGRSDVDGTRHIPLLTNAIAQSDYNVDTLQAGLGVRHRIGTQARNISPFAQVSYAQAKSDSYSEGGAGAYNLNVDGNTYESMRWTAGLEMAQALTPQFAITGKLAAAIENGDKYSKVSANFAAMPDESFNTIGQEVGREMGIAGIGIRYMPTARTTLSAGYEGEWRDNYDDQGAKVSLQMLF